MMMSFIIIKNKPKLTARNESGEGEGDLNYVNGFWGGTGKLFSHYTRRPVRRWDMTCGTNEITIIDLRCDVLCVSLKPFILCVCVT